MIFKDFNENSPAGFHTYYVYIMTNKYRTTLYIGVTNDIKRRIGEHRTNKEMNPKSFTGKYYITDLIYFETFTWIQNAIAREKKIKKWNREKKMALIRLHNPMLTTITF
ncbi:MULTISPECIES: GIY-YIG nuclease family protein [unclassified Myroides]|uniref:GIY-YIG nuclease family protein n=1 Tax=unclassified Myroides TaxID=2642485 RepID=UPI003D2F70BE